MERESAKNEKKGKEGGGKERGGEGEKRAS